METPNTEIMDLSEFRFDGTWDWWTQLVRDWGYTTAEGMALALESMAARLSVSESIDIPSLCKNPQKIGATVKIACVIVALSNRIKTGPVYEMNNTYTRLRRIA